MVVCNAVSGSGKGRAYLSVVRRTLDEAGVSYAYEVTKGRGHAAQLARSAISAGCPTVVAIGGDGTFFEVVNGVMHPAEPDGGQDTSPVAVGLVQAGRGSDFGRSIGVPADVEAATARLLDGRTRVIDLGYTTFAG